MNKFAITAAFVYILCMAAVAYGMFTARRSAIQNYGSAAAADQWETSRVEAATHSGGEGPVDRRPPKSDKPPALMLMTEHFGTCLALSWLLTSILYATLVVMVRGAAAEGGADHEEEAADIG